MDTDEEDPTARGPESPADRGSSDSLVERGSDSPSSSSGPRVVRIVELRTNPNDSEDATPGPSGIFLSF